MPNDQNISAPDLTTRPPCNARSRLDGYALPPRMLDKGRAEIAGISGEFHYNCSLDQHVINFLGIDAIALREQLLPTSPINIVASRDLVTLFRGGAGTGKSYLLRRVQSALEGAGHRTLVLAPQRQQVLDLERDGLTRGQTVAEFLTGDQAPPHSVVIVDEAGQIGAKQLLELLRSRG